MPNIIFVLLRRIHTPLIMLITVYAISILGFVLIPGQDDQGQPWRMDFFHAFYFVSFMGTTIGFGEIPYPFTDGQRMWATVTIYATVISWLYGIGSMLSLIQEPAFRRLLTETAFRRSLNRLNEPFYLVCGYGDTGSLLVEALTEAGIRAVVIDKKQDRIDALALEDFHIHVPGLCADAAMPDVLGKAGLLNKHCVGVVALTNVDHTNLQISITAKLLAPNIPTIARAETHDAEANIASFGTNHVINPFDTFAGRLALAIHSPSTYLLYEWMTCVPHEDLREPLFPPRGLWILCGYGRFGKAVHERLLAEGIDVVIVEAKPHETGAPEGTIVGRGTEAETLIQANIKEAVGIVAATDDDANNLSIIMTAHQLNSKLFMVGRQNVKDNAPIFTAANLDLIMKRGSIIAHKIFAIVTTPLLADFLDETRKRNNDWANMLISRIGGVTGDVAPLRWRVLVSSGQAPALSLAIANSLPVTVGHLVRDPRNRDDRLKAIPLLLKRGKELMVLPEESETLHKGDELLFCGNLSARSQMQWTVRNHNVLSYVFTGQEKASTVLSRLLPKRDAVIRTLD